METKEIDKEISGFSSADPHKDGADRAPRGLEPEPATGKPLLLIDIDGVISLFGGVERSSGDPFAGRAGSFHSIDGMPHFLSSKAAAHLLDLQRDFELVWCSGWEEKADEHLPHLLGLPPGLPFLRFERSVGRANAHWKLAAIDEFAGVRALAWIDDALNPACHEWAAARSAPTLLVQTEPEHGLTEREAELLGAWARELRAAG
ncbi:MAG TPA: HAD domain-containing protein [Solirubrobacteraceae bacterium]